MPTAQSTPAGEMLRAMLPDGADPDATIELACHTAFLARDRELLPGLLDVVKTDPEMAAGLIIALAALVDVDARPADMLDWLGTHDGRGRETARHLGALVDARAEAAESVADTLPPVTLESMREMAHAARLANVLQPCGTIGAAGRHVKRRQELCPRCDKARWLYDRATPEERAWLKTPPTRPARRESSEKVDFRGAVTGVPPTVGPLCGEGSGYRAHKRRGEDPCDACIRGRREEAAERRVQRSARQGKTVTRRSKEIRHGDHPGWLSHKRRGEEPCDPCLQGHNAYNRNRYAARRAALGKTVAKLPAAATVHRLRTPPAGKAVQAA